MSFSYSVKPRLNKSSKNADLSTCAEIEWNKRKLQEEDESEDQSDEPKMLPEQELEKIKSNLGRLILKEEKEKAIHFRRKTQSLPDRTHMHTSTAQRLLL